VEEPPGQLLVVGDWGSGTLPQGAVAGSMQRHAEAHVIDAILTTGDNFYSDDTEFLMRPYGWVEEQEIPWWITWGNHDVESESRIEAIDETFGGPPRWVVYEWGRVDVVILDSNQVSSLEQAVFFLQSMAATDRPMIVALHHPPYSCSHNGSTIEVVNEMIGLLDDDVVLVLAGHDHNYQRFENAGVSYIVTGGGGQTLYELNECPDNHPEMLAGVELHHFLVIEQTDSSLEVWSVDVNGEVIERVSVPLP
jgi:acid phosphatase